MKKCKWKIAVFRKLKSYLPNDNFSPESGGSVKPKTAIDAIRTHGTIKLKKQYKVRLETESGQEETRNDVGKHFSGPRHKHIHVDVAR